MGLFDFLKTKSYKQFVTESEFKTNHSKQIQMTPQTLNQLRSIDVSEEQQLKLEYFFYTNELNKAVQLSDELKKVDYSVVYEQSEGDKKLFVITGWSTKMQMSNNVVEKWTSDMCELGYKFDCEFDGWGTTPDQD
jgi:regulator of RNase E activity RraB